MKNKLTDINFDKHELLIVDNEHVKIHHLKVPNTSQDNIKFINCGGIMAVCGDYGNWIFCREFVPGSKEQADSQYMTEKLRIASSQEPYEMDTEATKKEIQTLIGSGDFTNEEEVEYLLELLDKADCTGEEYRSWAYENCPSDMSEYIPYVKTIKYWLKAVYDGYDEICKRLKEAEENSLL